MKEGLAKTKILATIGPASDSEKKLISLIESGVDAFRMNFSHGSYEYFDKLFSNIHKVREKLGLPIPILQDLQGPKIRVGELEQPEIELVAGDKIEITTKKVMGSKEKISITYDDLIKDAVIGDKILIDDGLIHLIVIKKNRNTLFCEVVEGGTLKPKKGINLPGMKLSAPSITEKDYEDLKFGLNYKIDFIALSFVRTAQDIIQLKKWLAKNKKTTPIIAKIEKKEAVDNFEEILKEADGIMVARGDLGVELPPEDVPIIQKQIIKKCNEVGKLVITATQMFESMIENPVPTRAEASDVANAVWDGTDVVMLSGETSVGKYPVEAVKLMNKILQKTEAELDYKIQFKYRVPHDLVDNLFDSLGKASVIVANQVEAACIVVFTNHGRKAKVISKYKPTMPVIAISNEFDTLNYLNLQWGITPYFMKDYSDEDAAIKAATEIIKKEKLAGKDDVVIFTSGAPYTEHGRKNWTKFVVI